MTDSNPFNNDSAWDTTTFGMNPSADISISKAALSGGPVSAGGQISYSLAVTNNGPTDSANVQLADTLPANTSFVSLTQTSGPAFSCTTPEVGVGGVVTCNIGLLTTDNPTATFTLALNVDQTAPDGFSVINTATADSVAVSPHVPTANPNPANNASSSTVTVTNQADLGVTKTGPVTAQAGDSITYTITVSNNGPQTALDSVLSDLLPPQTTFVSLSAPSGVLCTTPAVGATGIVNCTLPAPLLMGTSAVFTLTVQTAPAAIGFVINTAVVIPAPGVSDVFRVTM